VWTAQREPGESLKCTSDNAKLSKMLSIESEIWCVVEVVGLTLLLAVVES
jgi:hypothetical protein